MESLLLPDVVRNQEVYRIECKIDEVLNFLSPQTSQISFSALSKNDIPPLPPDASALHGDRITSHACVHVLFTQRVKREM